MAREMKNSEASWIDNIPKSWIIVNLRQVFSFGKGLPITKDNLIETGIPVISYGQIHSKANNGVCIKPELVRYVDDSYVTSNPESLVQQNDFIVADTSEDLAGCGNSVFVDTSNLLFAGYHTIILRNNKSFYNKYFAFLFQSDAWRKQIRERVTGVKLFSISQKILRTTAILLPPIDEQKRIADYLEIKCNEIDSVLNQTRASIEEYKKLKQAVITQAVTKGIRPGRQMKDSGVEWIGEIPVEWNTPKLKYFANIRSGITLGKTYPRETRLVEYPYLRVANVKDSYVDLSDVATIRVTEEEALKYQLQNGELLMTEGGDRDKLGRGTVWHAEIDPCLHQNHIFALHTSQRLLVEYVSYISTSFVGRDYFDVTANQSVHLASTNSTTIMNFTIPLPSFEEQTEVVEYLDKKTDMINKTISVKEKLLIDLDSYKKSLIYEYVTGKKEVPT